jgi:Ca2+-binding EF-hand superfamily protein
MTGREIKMITRLFILLTSVAILAAGNAGAQAASRTASPVKMFDTDNDGTLDLAEAKKAASAAFAKLDRDHDGTLDRRELPARLSVKEFQAADPDHDGTLK